MAFHFPLEAVLRCRRSIEHEQELHLQQANQKLAATKQRILGLEDTLAKIARAQFERLESGTTAAEIQFSLFCRAALLRQLGELEAQKVHDQTACGECLRALREASQLRQAIENLRDQQLMVYQQEGRRRDQSQLDDLFLARRKMRPDDCELPGS